MGKISLIKFEEVIHKGIHEAEKDNYDWNTGTCLLNAPEYLMTVYIARLLGKIDGAKYITLESNPEVALIDSGATRKKGPLPSAIRKDGRMDIMIWWGNDSPRAIIEVKRNVYSMSTIRSDIERIKGVLNRQDSSFQFGAVAFNSIVEGNSKDLVVKRFKKLFDTMKKNLKENEYNGTLSYKIIRNDEELACASCVIIFK